MRRVLERRQARRDTLQRQLADLAADMKALTGEASLNIADNCAVYDALLAKSEAIKKKLLG